jgi:hypothetical protein
LVEETGVSGKKTPDLSQAIDKFYQIMLYRVQLITLVVTGTDCG